MKETKYYVFERKLKFFIFNKNKKRLLRKLCPWKSLETTELANTKFSQKSKNNKASYQVSSYSTMPETGKSAKAAKV